VIAIDKAQWMWQKHHYNATSSENNSENKIKDYGK